MSHLRTVSLSRVLSLSLVTAVVGGQLPAFVPTAEARVADDVAKAAKTYSQAQQAELAEQYALAADLYSLAYQLAPSAEALRGSIRMALKSEKWVLAAGRAEQLKNEYPDDAASQKLAASTLERTLPLVAEVEVDCGSVDCTILVDGKATGLEPASKHRVYVAGGTRQISGGYPMGESEAVEIQVAPGGSSKIELIPPEPEEIAPAGGAESGARLPTEEDDDLDRGRRWQRLSPWFFGVGAAATVGVAVGGVVSGLQARQAGEDFRDNGQTQPLYDDADKLEKQTNALFAASGGLAVVTIAFGIFTDWKGQNRKKGRKARASLGPGPTRAGTSLTIRF